MYLKEETVKLEVHTGNQLRVLNYSEHALSAGTQAEAIAYVELNDNGAPHVGVATSHDTVSSMLKATLAGLNAAISQDNATSKPIPEVA